jgi:hypothetical protein
MDLKPTLDMKIRTSRRVCDQSSVDGKSRLHLDEGRPFLSLIWNLRFEPICVARRPSGFCAIGSATLIDSARNERLSFGS